MYCKCGNKIVGHDLVYQDYCKECNKAIVEYLEAVKPKENKDNE